MRMFIFKDASLIADHRFDARSLLIGSAEDCTVHLRDSGIAGRHARVECDADDQSAWAIEPLDTEHLTLLNGASLRARKPLRDLDEITVGSYLLKVYLSGLNDKQVDHRPRAAIDRIGSTVLPPGALTRIFGESFVFTPMEFRAHAALTSEFSRIFTLDQLVDAMIPRLRTEFKAQNVCVHITHRTADAFEVARGADAQERPIDVPELANALKLRHTQFGQCVCIPRTPDGSKSVLAMPIVGNQGRIIGQVYMDTPVVDTFDARALDRLTTFVSAIATPLERVLHEEAADRAAMSGHDIAMARTVQESLSLSAMPNWPEVQVACYRRHGSLTCSDHYDLIRLANKTASFMAAHISAPGALLCRIMAATHATYRTSSLHADPPHVFLRTLNWLLSDARGGWSMDIAAAWIEPEDGVVRYCIAGDGVSAGVVTSGGDCRKFDANSMPAIGAARGFAYAGQTDRLEPGDVLTMITVGADEVRNVEGKTFGRGRVAQNLCDMAGRSPNVMLSDLLEEMNDYAHGGVSPSDFTVVLARREA